MDEMEIVRRLYHMFYRMRKEGLQMHGKETHHSIRNRDLMLLDMIMHNGNMMKMSDISAYFDVTPAAISQMVRPLENKKWIERIILDEDRRSVYIKVSAIGKEVMEENEKHISDKIMEIINILGEEDSEALIRILDKCRIYLKQQKEKQGSKKGDHAC